MVEFQAGRKAVSGAIRVPGKAEAESKDCCKIVLIMPPSLWQLHRDGSVGSSKGRAWRRGLRQEGGGEGGVWF